MKLTVSSKVGALTRSLGMPASAPLVGAMPACVSDDYDAVWPKFLETDAVRDILSKYAKAQARYYVGAAFASYISSMDKRAVRGFSPVDSAQLFSIDSQFRTIRDFLLRKQILSSLRQRSHVQDVEWHDSDFLRAVVHPMCKGSAAFVVQGRNASLDKHLDSMVPTLYKSVPYELRRTVRNKERKILTAEAQLKSKIGWFGLLNEGGLFLEMARARLNTLVLRYRIDSDAIVFYGSGSPATADKAIRDVMRRHTGSLI